MTRGSNYGALIGCILFWITKKNEIPCFNGTECNYICKIYPHYLIPYYYKNRSDLIRYCEEKKMGSDLIPN